MEKLEQVLEDIEALRWTSLFAERVIQEEEICTHSGHCDGRWDQGEGYDWERIEITKPRIAEPDHQRRETAKQKLEEISNSSYWLSARYLASSNKCKLKEYVQELERRFSSPSHSVSAAEDAVKLALDTHDPSLMRLISDNYRFNKDLSTRKKLGSLLREKYEENWNVKDVVAAGTMMGYADRRINLHIAMPYYANSCKAVAGLLGWTVFSAGLGAAMGELFGFAIVAGFGGAPPPGWWHICGGAGSAIGVVDMFASNSLSTLLYVPRRAGQS